MFDGSMKIRFYLRITAFILILMPWFTLAQDVISIGYDNNSYPISIDPFRQNQMLKAEGNNWFYGSDSPNNQGKPPPESGSKASFTMIWLVPVLRYLVTIEGTNIGLQNEPVKVLLPIILTGLGSWWNGGEIAVDLAEHSGEKVKGDPVYVNPECMDGGDSPQTTSQESSCDGKKGKVEVRNKQQKHIKRKRKENDEQNADMPPPSKTPRIDQNARLQILAELLNHAIHDRKPEIVKALLEEEGADPDSPWQGEYPLHLAEKKLAESHYPVGGFSQSLQIFLLIVENGADLDLCSEGKTLLEKLFSELLTRKPDTGMQYPPFRKLKDKYIVFQVLLEMGASITTKDFLFLLMPSHDSDVYIRTIALRAFECSHDNPEQILYEGLTILQYVWDHPLYSHETATWLLTQWGGVSWKNENFCQIFDAFKSREKSRGLVSKIIHIVEQFPEALLLSEDVDMFRKAALLLRFSFLCQPNTCDGCEGIFPCRYKRVTDKVVEFLNSHKIEVFSCKDAGLTLVEYAVSNPEEFPDEAIKFLVINTQADPSLIEVEGEPFILHMVSNRGKYSNVLFSWLLDQCKQSSEVLSAQFGLALLQIFPPLPCHSRYCYEEVRGWGEWYDYSQSSVDLINRGADLFIQNDEGLCTFVLILREAEKNFGLFCPELFSAIDQSLKNHHKDRINSLRVRGMPLLSYLMDCWGKGELTLEDIDQRIQLALDAGYLPRHIDTSNLVGRSVTAAAEVNDLYQKLLERMGLKYASLLAVFETSPNPSEGSDSFEVLKHIKDEVYKQLEKIRRPLILNKVLWSKAYDWRKSQNSEYLSEMKNAVEDGADVNALTYGEYPLHIAVENQNIVAIDMFLANGADIEARNESGLTPLLLAAKKAFSGVSYKDRVQAKILEVIRLLLDRGADIEARSNTGRTALHRVTSEGFSEAVDELLRRKANIEARDATGLTALHFAAYYDHVNIAKKLLEEGADVDSVADEGDTALLWAASKGHKNIVLLLLENGADSEVSDKYGNLPQDLAENNGFYDCAAIIYRHRNELPDDPENQ